MQKEDYYVMLLVVVIFVLVGIGIGYSLAWHQIPSWCR